MRPPSKRERRPGQGAALETKSNLTSVENKHPRRAAQVLRMRCLAERVHGLGPRVVAELLAELVDTHGQAVVDRIEIYAAINPDALRLTGGDRFPAKPIRRVA